MLEGLKAYLKRFPAVVGIHRAIRNTRVHRAISNIRNDWRDVWDTFLASRCLLLQTTTRYGFKFHTGNSNTHREMLIGTFEPEEMGLVESHLSGAQVFVDVGANIGLYTCLARSRGRHTIAIEPQQKNLSILYFNLRENLYNDVEVYPLGLSDQPGITVLYGASGTSASLISGWSGGGGQRRRVCSTIPTTTLDILLGERFAGKRLLVKIDVEGAEYGVLSGAEKTIREKRHTWLMEICLNEYHPSGLNPTYAATFELFWKNGYEARTANRESRIISPADIKRWVLARRADSGTFNYIFTPGPGSLSTHVLHGQDAVHGGSTRISKIYIRVPGAWKPSALRRVKRAFLGSILSPAYWFLASRLHAPGLNFRRFALAMAFRFLTGGSNAVSYKQIYEMMFWPMLSTRYFEFDFMWRMLSGVKSSRYLDVSSPRLLPIVLLDKNPGLTAELLNPDVGDLAITGDLVRACGLSNRCHLHDCRIETSPFEDESFDLITCISVLEHIPDDKMAVKTMWRLLKPGGVLLLSMPCAAKAVEQYTNVNAYGLPVPQNDGFSFFQRLYDHALCEENIFSIAGLPAQTAIHGENQVGFLRKDLDKRWSDPNYPIWKEPYTFAREFRNFENLADLPGEGVIAMMFKKS